MAAVNTDAPSTDVVLLHPIAIHNNHDDGVLAFEEFGKVVFSRDDGGLFSSEAQGGEDAQLDLMNGTPRFYVMKLSPAQVCGFGVESVRVCMYVCMYVCVCVFPFGQAPAEIVKQRRRLGRRHCSGAEKSLCRFYFIAPNGFGGELPVMKRVRSQGFGLE